MQFAADTSLMPGSSGYLISRAKPLSLLHGHPQTRVTKAGSRLKLHSLRSGQRTISTDVRRAQSPEGESSSVPAPATSRGKVMKLRSKRRRR